MKETVKMVINLMAASARTAPMNILVERYIKHLKLTGTTSYRFKESGNSRV